jgi:hypothetical protein
MERRFFTNDFEQSLKEHADKFQMVPSKKVWHGIYNDLHPGKRWPSVTMSLLLIFTLVVIGHLNTNNSRQLAYLTNKISEAKKVTANVKKAGSSKNSQRIVVRKTDLDKGRKVFVYATGQSNHTGVLTQPIISNYQSSNLKTDQLLTNNLKPWNNSGSSVFEKNFMLSPQPNSNSGEGNIAENVYNNETRLQNNVDLNGMLKETLQGKIVANHFDNQLTKKTLIEKKNTSNSEELSPDKNIDDIILAKSTPNAESKVAKLHKKRNDKITWVYFAAPVVSSVAFSGEPLKQSPGTNFSPALPVNQKENKVLHHSALGLEAGAQMNYSLTKKLQFTTGVHLTYSGYHITSNEVHPTFATLVLRDPATGMTYSRSFITHYGDGTGQSVVTIHNYNWQASIPFGLQYEFFGNNKVQVNVGANLEPSLVLKSNAYILSSDGNNYVNDPSLLRKWNFNSNFGAFVTFRSSKFKWQIGPNIRYQWLSTYQKDYTVKEHLIDYGIRIGISK